MALFHKYKNQIFLVEEVLYFGIEESSFEETEYYRLYVKFKNGDQLILDNFTNNLIGAQEALEALILHLKEKEAKD